MPFVLRTILICFILYYFRRYWLTPWARYVSHSGSDNVGYFVTVKHVTWYPPFLEHTSTYYRKRNADLYNWANVDTGQVPYGCSRPHSGKQLQLDGILLSALARDQETEELTK